MHSLDYIAIVVYLLFTVGLGVWFGRGQSRKEFFAGGGAMTWLPVGLSVMATLFSSNSFAFYPAAAYKGTLLIGLSLVSFTLMTPIIVKVFIPMFVRLNCTTAYEYLEKRFHVSVRCLASGLFIFLRIGWIASMVFAASLVIATVAGISQINVILGVGAISVGYTMLGGLRAVMWTDVVQFFVFAATIVVSLILIVTHSGSTAGELTNSYFSGRDGIFVNFEWSMTLQYGSWVILIGVFLEALSAFGADQVAVQRYLAAKDEKTAQTGAWVNLAGMWLVVPGLLAIGVGLHGYFQKNPEGLLPVLEAPGVELKTDEVPTAANANQLLLENGLADKAMPQFVKLHFPPGMLGLFLAAVMAAMMSSLDSGIHSVTTAVVVDFRDRLWPQLKPKEDKRDVFLIRGLVVLIGAISIALACLVVLKSESKDIFAVGKLLTSAFGGPLLAIFLLAFFFKRAGSRAVLIGAVLGAAITLILIKSPIAEDWFAVWFWPIGTGLAIAISIPLSYLEQPKADPLTWWRVVRK
ncbi:MAG: SSS family solute:Na+ symporter [Verrucomicrobiales bacterium]|jgi:SSS family solute:Na+ symporter